MNSRSILNYEACVFSGLIPIKEIIDPNSAPSWYASKGPVVPVDKLYDVKGAYDLNKRLPSIKKIIDISQKLE